MMISLLISLLVSLMMAFHFSAVSAQTFSFIQPATGPSSVCEGSDVTLQCVVVLFISTNNMTILQTCSWTRAPDGIQATTLPNHRQVFNSTTGAFSDLVITNVTLEDDNTVYNCTNPGSTVITSSVMLNVTDPLANLTINEDNCGLDSFSISWSSPVKSVCNISYYTISYDVTLFIILDDGSHEMLDTDTDITITYYSFTGLSSSTLYLVEVIPIYNGLVGYSSNITVRTKDQPSSTLTTSVSEMTPTVTVSTSPTPSSNTVETSVENDSNENTTVIIIVVIIVVIVVVAVLVIIILGSLLCWRHFHKEGGIKPNENDENQYAQANAGNSPQEKPNEEYAYAVNGPRGVVFPSTNSEMPQKQ